MAELGDAGDLLDSRSDPAEIVLDREFTEPVQIALASLSEEYRTVVLLADMEELDYAEVSDILGIPIGTVRSRLHRARNMLRTSLLAKKLL